MNLHTGTYYWPTTFPDAPTYTALDKDLYCDVVVFGGLDVATNYPEERDS